MGESLRDRLDKPHASKTAADFAGILSKMLGGAQRFEVCRTTWPKTDVKIGLRLLSDWEVQEAMSKTRAWAEGEKIQTGPDRMDDAEFVARYACEVLSIALCDPEKPTEGLVSCADELAKTATREEIDRLSTEMSDHQEAFAPFPEQLNDDELKRLVDALKKAPRTAATTCRPLAPSTLRRCIISLVNPPKEPTGSSSSPSSPPTGTTPAS